MDAPVHNPASRPVDTAALIGAARGLAWLSSSILLTMLLFLLNLSGLVVIVKRLAGGAHVLLPWHVPPFLLGPAVGLGGLRLLRPADRLTAGGPRHRRQARGLLLLQAFFALFIGGWQAAPDSLFFFGHLLLFLLSFAGLLLVINRLAGDAGGALAADGVVSEALFSRRLVQWGVLPLTLALGAAGLAQRTDLIRTPGWLLALLPPEAVLPPWLHSTLLAGALMTMLVCWKCGHACYGRLARGGGPAAPDALRPEG